MAAKKTKRRTKRKTKNRYLEAEDICRLKLINSVAISPDERKIAYALERVSEDKKKY